MARYSYGMRSTVVGTTARAMMSIFSSASGNFRLVEVSVTNTTATATAIALARFTAATNAGTGQTEGEYDNDGVPPLATVFAGHTGDGTTGQILRQASVGAAIGAGIVWTFGNGGILVPSGTANGIGVIGVSGVTGQICDIDFTWDE
jgi:hypothetical protein